METYEGLTKKFTSSVKKQKILGLLMPCVIDNY